MNKITLGATLLIIIILVFLVLFKKSSKIKESFERVCDGCDFPGVERMLQNPMKFCILYGCKRESQKKERSRKWNNGKTNTIVRFSQGYIDKLKEYDFGNFSSQDNYADKLETYLRELNNNFKRYIDKANQHPWSMRFDGDFDRSRANNCTRIVNNCHQILSDIKSANDYVKYYYQVDVEETRESSNQDLLDLRNRLANYFYHTGEYSDIENSDLDNNFRATDRNFWKAIYSSWYTLEYLRVLISWYPNGPLMGSMRSYLSSYKVWFNGSTFPPYNINQESLQDVNHIYKWQENRLAGYAGNDYQNTGKVSDTRGGIDISKAPVNERYNAYNNFLYETLGNCQRQYSNFDNWTPYGDRYSKMNSARDRTSRDNRTNDIYAQKETINYTKNLFWEPNNGTTWRPNQTEDNYRTCEPLPDSSTPGTETETNSTSSQVPNIYNFKENSDNLETKRKKIQYARKDVFSSLVGEDSIYFVNEPLPECPLIDDQENKHISKWTRSDDSLQPVECKARNSFLNEKSNFQVNGIMKPGCIVNGQDIWIENYDNITEKVNTLKEITENTSKYDLFKNSTNNWEWRKDHRHTTLIRLAGGMKERILKDRDWQLGTQKWIDKDKMRDTNNSSYFIENYLKMYYHSKIDDSSIFDFEIHFKENNISQKYSSSIIFITDRPTEVSDIKIKSLENNLGVVKVYHNMYKYSYYVTGPNNPKINLPSIENAEIPLLSLIYNNLNWEKDELIEYGHDLYIICSNTRIPHNLYSSNNGFLYHESGSQFGKCFYSNKNQTRIPSEDFIWTIFKNTENDTDMLYHKATKKFLGLGINYQLGNNFSLDTGILMANQNLDDNKETRDDILYFVEKRILENLKESLDPQDKSKYNAMIIDCSWNIQKNKDNEYSIHHPNTGKTLWFTSNHFIANANMTTNSKLVEIPLSKSVGYIHFDDISMEEESQQPYCDNLKDEKCYNKYFYIVPTEPENVTSSFINSNELSTTNLFQKCPKQQGNNTLNKDNWYQSISVDEPIPYADVEEPTKNRYSNIYKMYGDSGDYNKGVLSLNGGGGKNCSKSNFCHVEKKLLSNDRSDKSPNPIEMNKLPNNKQTESQSLSVSVKDWFNRPTKNFNYSVPLNKYNYQCNRNQFNIYKLFGNKTNISFNSIKNPNMSTSKDDSYDINDSNREVAISIYSTNKNYLEGRDFGMFPDGTSVWFVNVLENGSSTKTYLNLNQLKIIKKNINQLHRDFIFISNMSIDSQLKRKKQKIITWDDEMKFKNIGYQDFKKEKIFAYKNMMSSYIN